MGFRYNMKLLNFIVSSVLLFVALTDRIQAQTDHHHGKDSSHVKSFYQKKKTYIVVTNDGAEFIGEIISDDAREILMNTRDRGQMYIPKHTIKSVQLMGNDNYQNGELITENHFPNHYMFSSNVLPLKKREFVANTYYFLGYSLNYSVNENVAVGVHTSIVGRPIGLGLKTSFTISEMNYLGVEMHGGFLSIDQGNYFMGHIGVKYTRGNEKANFSVGAGVVSLSAGFTNTYSGTASINGYYLNAAGCSRISKKSMFVLEGFTAPDNKIGLVAFGLRSMKKEHTSFTFGLCNLISQRISNTSSSGSSGVAITRVQPFPYFGMCFKM